MVWARIAARTGTAVRGGQSWKAAATCGLGWSALAQPVTVLHCSVCLPLRPTGKFSEQRSCVALASCLASSITGGVWPIPPLAD